MHISEQITAAATRRERAAQLAAAAALQAVAFADNNGRTALAGEDMSQPGMFRLTRFDQDGPIGHTQVSSLTEAVDMGLKEGFIPIDFGQVCHAQH